MQKNTINILVVEDNKADRRLIEILLSKISGVSCEIFFAETLLEAIEITKVQAINIILLDLGLPDSQGLETFNRFHTQFADLPVILFTSLDDENVAVEAIKQGAQDVLYKGKIDTSSLIKSILLAIERHKLSKTLNQTNYKLTERMKELHCLLSLSKIIEKNDRLEDFFKNLVNIIPPGWQYPEKTCARLLVNNEIYTTDNFKLTPWQQKAPVYEHKKEVGSLEVFYLEEMPELDLGPFLKEEQILLEAIAERTGKVIERNMAEAALILQNEELQAKEEELTSQNEELASQNEELIAREDELKQLSERYIKLFHNSPSGVAVYSVENNGNDFIFKEFNNTSEKMYKRKKEDVIGKNVIDVFPGIVDMGLLDIFKEVWKTGQPDFQSDTLYKDGSFEAWHENFVYKISNNEIVAVYLDTTEKVKKETDLLLTKFFIDNAASGAVLANKNASYIYVNKSYSDISGYSLDELATMHIYDVNANFTKDNWPEYWLKTKEKKSFTFESQIISKDKKIKDVKVSTNFISYNDNEYIFGIIEDITDKKISENLRIFYSLLLEKLHNSKNVEETIATIIDNIQEYFDIDAIGIRLKEGYDYPYINTYGFSQQFLETENSLCCYDKNNKIILDEDGKPLLQCVCGLILRQEIDYSQPFFNNYGTLCINKLQEFSAKYPEVIKTINLRGKCIAEGFESLMLVPVKIEQEFIGLIHLCSYKKDFFNDEIVSFFENIALGIGIAIHKYDLQKLLVDEKDSLDKKVAEKTVELQLLIKKLEEVNKHKSQFLNNMSHELRTPLNAILGFSQSLEKQYFGTLNDKQSEYVGLIKDSGNHLLTLINDILDFAKVDAGKVEVNKNVLSTSEYIKTTISMVGTLFKEKNIELTYHINEDANLIYADINLLKQILLNLLSNALKFTNSDGKVVIYVEKIDSNIKFSVTDNGIGIHPEDQEKIFEEFYQTKHSINQAIGGTGIGLSLCKKLIKLHEGEIGVESEPNQGSTFWFTIPVV